VGGGYAGVIRQGGWSHQTGWLFGEPVGGMLCLKLFPQFSSHRDVTCNT